MIARPARYVFSPVAATGRKERVKAHVSERRLHSYACDSAARCETPDGRSNLCRRQHSFERDASLSLAFSITLQGFSVQHSFIQPAQQYIGTPRAHSAVLRPNSPSQLRPLSPSHPPRASNTTWTPSHPDRLSSIGVRWASVVVMTS